MIYIPYVSYILQTIYLFIYLYGVLLAVESSNLRSDMVYICGSVQP